MSIKKLYLDVMEERDEELRLARHKYFKKEKTMSEPLVKKEDYNYSTYKFHQAQEDLVDILVKKTGKDERGYFRILIAYKMAEIASHMRTTVDYMGTEVPVNLYAVNLATSGFSKDMSMNILDKEIYGKFRQTFEKETMPSVSELSLQSMADLRVIADGIEQNKADRDVQFEYNNLPKFLYSFGAATIEGYKALRNKLSMAEIGATSYIIGEIGSSMQANAEALTELLNCYPGDIELLTEKGFQRFDKLDKKIKVAQYHKDGTIDFVKPLKYIEEDYDGDLFTFKSTNNIDFSVTDKHDMTIRKSNGDIVKKKPHEVNTADAIILTGKLKDEGKKISDLLRFQIAFQADGSFKGVNKNHIEFSFSKTRKITRMNGLLHNLGVRYTSHNNKAAGQQGFRISASENVLVSKDLNDFIDIMNLDLSQAREIINEAVEWDGSRNENNLMYSSTVKANSELMATIGVLAGYKTKITKQKDDRSVKYSDIYRVTFNISHKGHCQLPYLDKVPPGDQTEPTRTISKFKGKVYCVSMPTTHIVIRKNGKACIGGQSYDMGLSKQKLIKNDSNAEMYGAVPSNLFMFGTQSKLFDGGKVEQDFFDLLEEGYGRRLFFGYVENIAAANKKLTPEEIYDIQMDTTTDLMIKSMAAANEKLADVGYANQKMSMSKEVAMMFIKYRSDCDERTYKMKPHEDVKKAVTAHGYWRAVKLAGAYAFIDEETEISMVHAKAAIALVEQSNKSFDDIARRPTSYIKLINYMADVDRAITQVELVENLPFYKGSEYQKKEMMTLALAHGYMNKIVVKKTYSDGVEFFKAERLDETDLNQMNISWSIDITNGYTQHTGPWTELPEMICENGYHYTVNSWEGGHRNGDNLIPGFNICVLDVDGGTSIKAAQALLEEYEYIIYETKRSTPALNRFRILIPLSHTLKLNRDDFKEFMLNVFEYMPFNVDDQTGDCARKWLSNKSTPILNKGKLLDVYDFLPNTKKQEEMHDLLEILIAS